MIGDFSLPMVILARPMRWDDPLLARGQDGHIVPRLLDELQRQGLGGAPVFCFSTSVPQDIQEAVAAWGADCVAVPEELPQARLARLFADRGYGQALLLTAYSSLLDREDLAAAQAAVVSGECDAAYKAEAIPANFFMVLNAACVQALAGLPGVINPFTFPRYLAEASGSLRLRGLCRSDDGYLAFKFLCDLMNAGLRGDIPADVLDTFLARTPPLRWFSREAVQAHIFGHYRVADSAALAECLRRVDDPDRMFNVAAKVRFLARVLPHLPQRRESFLEVGFGDSPVSSMFLLNLFERGVGTEPYGFREDCMANTVPLVEHISRALEHSLGFPLSRTRDYAGVADRLELRRSRIEDLGLAPGTLDLCFSKCVLEHVDDVVSTTRNLHAMLRPGGVMLHVVDFSDHEDNRNIRFDFLEHSREEWRALNKGTNLWRVSDFVELWEQSGFAVEVLDREVRRVPPRVLHPCWHGYAEQNLYCYSALLKAVKR